MKKTDWKETAELIGIAAIVASLVFVGLELRQSQQIAIAGQYQQRAEAFMTLMFNRLAFESEHVRLATLARNSYAGFVDDSEFDSMSDEAIAVIWTNVSTNLSMFDNNYFQYQSGLMSEEGWQAQRRRLQMSLERSAFYRAEILARGERYRDSFRDLATEIIEELE